jgi:Tfp pilus assembly protein PilN
MSLISINLLPEELRPQKKAKGSGGLPSLGSLDQEVLKPLLIGGLAFILVGLSPTLADWFWLAPRTASVEAAEAEIAAETTKLQATLDEVKRLDTKKTDLDKQFNLLNVVAGQRSTAAEMLDELRDLTPANVWYTAYKIDNAKDEVTLTGVSLDYASVAFLTRNLEHAKFYAEPVLTSTEKTAEGKQTEMVSFNLTIKSQIPVSNQPSPSPSPSAPSTPAASPAP